MGEQEPVSATPAQATVQGEGEPYYEICIEGELDHCWSIWFDNMKIVLTPNGQSVLSGPLRDQAALYGILIKIQNFGMPLVSVNRVSNSI